MKRLAGIVLGVVAALVLVVRAEPAAPLELATFDGKALKGTTPELLAWSADDQTLYVEAADRDHFGEVKSTRRFVIGMADHSVRGVGEEPAWASAYWQWKSSRRSPASTTAMLEMESAQKGFRSTNVPTGGDLGRGGADTGQQVQDAWSAAYQTQHALVSVIRWKGYTIGEWTNENMRPGSNFSWAPPPRIAVAFAPRGGGSVAVVDNSGNKTTIEGSRAATLPAWSQNGAKIAWLERRSRKEYVLVVADAPAK